jgi:hypothetical protein
VAAEPAGPGAAGHDRDRSAVVERARVAGGDRPALHEGRPGAGQEPERGVRPRALVHGHKSLRGLDRGDLGHEPAGLDRRARPLVTLKGERILALARDPELASDVLGRNPHLGIADRVRGELWPRMEAGHQPAPARRLDPPRRCADTLDAAGEVEVARSGRHQPRSQDHRLQAGPALPVHGHAGHLHGQASVQRGQAGDVASGPGRVPHDDVVHLGRVDPHRLDDVDEHGGQQAGDVYGGEDTACPADGRSLRRDDYWLLVVGVNRSGRAARHRPRCHRTTGSDQAADLGNNRAAWAP